MYVKDWAILPSQLNMPKIMVSIFLTTKATIFYTHGSTSWCKQPSRNTGHCNASDAEPWKAVHRGISTQFFDASEHQWDSEMMRRESVKKISRRKLNFWLKDRHWQRRWREIETESFPEFKRKIRERHTWVHTTNAIYWFSVAKLVTLACLFTK